MGDIVKEGLQVQRSVMSRDEAVCDVQGDGRGLQSPDY